MIQTVRLDQPGRRSAIIFICNSGAGPELKYGGAAVVAGQIGAGYPSGRSRRQRAMRLPGKSLAPISTRSGIPTAAATTFRIAIGAVSGTSAALESLETSFHQDLNGDGVIGVLAATDGDPGVGSTSLVEIGNNFYLDNERGRP